MLNERILATLKFFDLQDIPLTFFELHKYLIADLKILRERLDENFELTGVIANPEAVLLDVLLMAIDTLVTEKTIETKHGYYFLPQRENLVGQRLDNYTYGIKREKLIQRYLLFLRFIPFVRAVALAGSQALGQEKPNSDIDLLVITDLKYMWTARTLVTIYFQIFGVRRHGKHIANRFCLNHYIAGKKQLHEGRNLYAAMEYAKLRPEVYKTVSNDFVKENSVWIKSFFPNLNTTYFQNEFEPALRIQNLTEKLFRTGLGIWIEKELEKYQKKRIHTDQYVRVSEDELSFHPHSKQEKLLLDFFEFQKQNIREAV